MALPCALGFLEAWSLGSEGECPKRESQVDIVLSFITHLQKIHTASLAPILLFQMFIKAHLRRHDQDPALDEGITII